LTTMSTGRSSTWGIWARKMRKVIAGLVSPREMLLARDVLAVHRSSEIQVASRLRVRPPNEGRSGQ
jgi:hypothetical protein